MAKKNNLEWLQKYYLYLCNGDWEHTYGVRIFTMDNPGWHFEFELTDLPIEDKMFQKIENHKSDYDWFVCEVKEGKFIGFGGALNLEDVIGVFRDWVEGDFTEYQIDENFFDTEDELYIDKSLLSFKQENTDF